MLPDFRVVFEESPPDLQIISHVAVNQPSNVDNISEISSPAAFQQGLEESVYATQDSVPWDPEDIEEGDSLSATCEI